MKQHPETTNLTTCKRLKVSSTAFTDEGLIPSRFTCDGENINPPLSILQVPDKTRSMAIIVEDPDATSGTFVHWLMWNIPVTRQIREHESKGLQGINDFDCHHYKGPCPPAGTHRYFFKVYALDCFLDLPVSATRPELETAMQDNIIGYGELIGRYSRKGH